MLGKLIKHEWKAVWKFLATLVVFMLILTLVGGLGMLFIPKDMTNTISGIIIMLYTSTYIFGLIAVMIGVVIYLAIRFYRSMYSDEGYLTHTLPVTPLQLIGAKAIVAILSLWITYLVLLFSVITLSLCINALLVEDPIRMADALRFINELFEDIRSSGYSPIGIILFYLLLYAVNSIRHLLMIYGSFALGQLLNKHRTLGSIGIYFGFNMALQILSTLGLGVALTANRLWVISTSNDYEPYQNSFVNMPLFTSLNYGTLLFSVAMAVGFFLLTYLLTKKKLNLE